MRAITRRACLLVTIIVGVGAALAGCGASSSGPSSASSSGSGSASSSTSAAAATGSANAARCGNGSPSSASSSSVDGVPTANPGMSAFGQSSPGSCVYKGPGGFSIDLSKCPSNWTVNSGITSDSIKLFTSAPHSGALAAYGGIEDGAKSYFDYVNAHGGVDGHKIDYKIMDDQYQPNITAQNVNSAIQAGTYASSFAVFGTPNNLAVRAAMNKQCMGQWMVAASDDVFFDPQHYPWTTGFGLDRYNETDLWAQFLQKKFPSGTNAVMITMSGDLGQSYADGFTRATKGTKIKIVGDEMFAPTAPSITNQVTTAAATKAQVVILNVAGTYCTQALADIEKSSWKPTIVADNACAQVSTTYAPLLKEGATGNGSYTIRYYYAPTDPDHNSPAYVALYTKTLKAQGLDPTNAQYANGWWWGWDFVQVLQNAAQMKGGLNRATIAVAAHAFTSHWPLLMSGVVGQVAGVQDAFPYEAGRMYQYTGATSSKVGKFVPAGPLIDNSGKLKNYSAAQAAG